MVSSARDLAMHLHAGQVRKSNGLAYTTHLEETANIVANYGGSDLNIAAAWLHDAIEDQKEKIDVVKHMIDPFVLLIVKEVSENKNLATWQERKLEFLTRLTAASNEATFVKAADVLSNLRGLIRDGEGNPQIWECFKVGREKSLWYYESCSALLHWRAICEVFPMSLYREIDRTLEFVQKYI